MKNVYWEFRDVKNEDDSKKDLTWSVASPMGIHEKASNGNQGLRVPVNLL